MRSISQRKIEDKDEDQTCGSRMDPTGTSVPECDRQRAEAVDKGLMFPHTGSSTQSFDTMYGIYSAGQQQQRGSTTPSSVRRTPGSGGAGEYQQHYVGQPHESHPASSGLKMAQKELLYDRNDSFVRNNYNNTNVSDDDVYLSSCGYHAMQAGASPPGTVRDEAVQPSATTKESRVVLVEGIDPDTPDGLLKEQFECFGDIQLISMETKAQGYVLIVYHDIRAARLAMHSSGTQWRGRKLSCTMLDESEAHWGLKAPPTRLYLVSLDGGRSLDDVYYLLSSYGELKELKKDPLKPQSCCIAEFYDSRHAAAAFSDLKLVPGLADKLLILDASVKDTSSFDDTTSFQQAAKNPFQPTYHASLSNMTKNLSEISLESTRSQNQSYQGLSPPMLGRGTHSSSDMLSGRSNVSSGFGPGSSNTIWRNNSYGDSSSILAGSPPSGVSQWMSSNEVLAALQAQQRAALHLQAQNNVVQAALQNSFLTGGNDSVHQYRGVSNMMPRGQMARRNQSDPGLGGRLARSKMNPVAEAERKAHQDRMYGLNLNKILLGEDKRTTLMIKNIPNKYTQKMLLALLEERFAGSHPFPFDFFYLPIDFKNKCNVGYAFINMTTPLAIPALVEEFHGRRWPKFNSEKVCQIAYGRIQGKLSLIQHFQNSSLLHEDKRCRPVLFNASGDVEQFPIGPAALANFSLKHHASEIAKNESHSY